MIPFHCFHSRTTQESWLNLNSSSPQELSYLLWWNWNCLPIASCDTPLNILTYLMPGEIFLPNGSPRQSQDVILTVGPGIPDFQVTFLGGYGSLCLLGHTATQSTERCFTWSSVGDSLNWRVLVKIDFVLKVMSFLYDALCMMPLLGINWILRISYNFNR